MPLITHKQYAAALPFFYTFLLLAAQWVHAPLPQHFPLPPLYVSFVYTSIFFSVEGLGREMNIRFEGIIEVPV
jgi:hypothetical protein